MVGLGVLLIILGAGSMILQELGYEFRILSWATDYQPFAGIVIALVGVAVLGVAIARKKKEKQNVPPAA
jgi:hypothetical protein